MMKALMLAPMGSVHRRFNKANIDALLNLNFQIELAANFSNGNGPESHNQNFIEECAKKGIVTHSIPFERHSLKGSLKCLPQVKKLLREGNFDIVHAHTETGGLILKLAKGEKRECVFFYTPHGMSFWKGSPLKSQIIYRPLERWICSSMDANLAMNQEEYQTLRKWNARTAKFVHGIGLDVSRFKSKEAPDIRHEIGLSNQDVVLLSVGELDDNKNHAVVLKAMSQIKDICPHYVVCGVGPNKDYLLEMAKNLGIQDKLHLLGYRSDIPAVIRSANIFVFPSFHEGLPVSLMEAMAGGIPVICSEIRGNVDLIKPGYNGFLFKPDNANQLKEYLEKLIEDPALRKEISRHNMIDIENYSYNVVVEELKRLYLTDPCNPC